MPVISGVKMACEPCIRGHRSTKCNHANERLMVPVRKPGRPLSACPHPRDRPCNCSGVTAAIPKKQTCHCGTDTPQAIKVDPAPAPASAAAVPSTDPTSPTRASFRVQKPAARPRPRRTSSIDITKIERLDMNQVNMIPFDLRRTMPGGLSAGYSLPAHSPGYEFMPMYGMDHVYKPLMQDPPHMYPPASSRMSSMDGLQQMGSDYSFALPVDLGNGVSHALNDTSHGPPLAAEATSRETSGPGHERSCCATDPPDHSHNSSSASSISEPQEPAPGSCCSTQTLKNEAISSDDNLMHLTSPANQPMLLGDVMPLAELYPPYITSGPNFTYPSTYGSFQNPLQPSAWRQGHRASGYPPPEAQMPSTIHDFVPPIQPKPEDSTHNCDCGDSCQCVGCATHPYNNATQDYVRSAWSSMAEERRHSGSYANGFAAIETGPAAANGVNGANKFNDVNGANGMNGANRMNGANGSNGSNGTDSDSTPAANTPASSASGNNDEQNLSASDFLFVNYPFAACGGDTETCLCGDDCQCLGCTIHSQPSRHSRERYTDGAGAGA